jgi:hypothetical protein
MERVGFIGLGIMGQPMARNLLRAGFPLTVYTRDRRKIEAFVEQGAQGASSPREVAEQSTVVITSLPQFCVPSSPPATCRSPAPRVHASHDTPAVPHPPAVLVPGTALRPSPEPPVDFRPASHPPTSSHLARSQRFSPPSFQPALALLRRVPSRIYRSATACYH